MTQNAVGVRPNQMPVNMLLKVRMMVMILTGIMMRFIVIMTAVGMKRFGFDRMITVMGRCIRMCVRVMEMDIRIDLAEINDQCYQAEFENPAYSEIIPVHFHLPVFIPSNLLQYRQEANIFCLN